MTGTQTSDSEVTAANPEEPLTLSSEALAIVLETRAMEDDPGATALKVAITGSTMTDFKYSLELAPLTEATKTDLVYTQGTTGELTVIVPQDSAANMLGATLTLAQNNTGGLVIKNPNTPDPLQGLDLEAEGELPDKVKAVLEQAVNPALESHGGYASLLGVEDTNVYITMGGGCQGCAASAMTLRDGITKMLKDALPEIEEVIDATDHSAGENPFYT